MLDDETLDNYQQRLIIYRRTLLHLLSVEAVHGGKSFVPASIVNSIHEARHEIHKIKQFLRDKGFIIEDLPEETIQFDKTISHLYTQPVEQEIDIDNTGGEMFLSYPSMDVSSPLHILFVNRSNQSKLFNDMLDQVIDHRILLISSKPGMGKSWLLQTFAKEVRNRKLPLVYIDFADRQSYDFLELICCCCDQIGYKHFYTLLQEIKELSVVYNQENKTTRHIIDSQICNTFFICLSQICQQTSIVFLFDSYQLNSLPSEEWNPKESDRWISGQLLRRVRDGELKNIVVALAGRRIPKFGAEWNTVIRSITLNLLSNDDIKTYLCERRGLKGLTDNEIKRLCEAVGGSPQLLGLVGDNMVLFSESKINR